MQTGRSDLSEQYKLFICSIFHFISFLLLCSKRDYTNSLPNNNILDWSKLKANADDKIIVTEKFTFVLGRVENIVGKGENAGNQHFLLFQQCFQKASCTGV